LNLTSPLTVLGAWVLAPALVVIASAAMGRLLVRLTGVELGVLTIPMGFLTGIATGTALLSVGLSGKLTVVAMALVAIAGAVVVVRDLRRGGRLPRLGAAFAWPAAAFAVAYVLALAPLIGSGRSGMLGYFMNDDAAVHITLVEEIAQHNAGSNHPKRDAVHAATFDLDLGYPLGGYVWPLFARVSTGIDVFHLWTPLSALVLALMALVAYAILRDLLLPRALAAAGGTVVGVGYLLYAYHSQGGTKEVVLPLAVCAAAVTAARALDGELRRTSLVPATVAVAAAIANLGYGGAAWVGPLALAVLAVLGVRARRARSWSVLRPLAIPAALAAVFAIPVAIHTFDFFNAAQNNLRDEDTIGNLVGGVPFREAFNVWLAHDYRLHQADVPGLTAVGLWVALVLCVVGGLWTLRQRRLAIPLALLAGFAAVAVVAPQSSIYYDAKTYVAISPALGLATVAGLVAVARRGGALRVLAIVVAGLLAIGAIASDAYVYGGVWVTPRYRFDELAQVADRTRGQGPLLINEFEEYAPYILRDSQPWIDAGFRNPRGHRGHFPLHRQLDPDDYVLKSIERYRYVLDRKNPYGSRPPSNFTKVLETTRYRLWRRTGTAPAFHVPVGRDGFLGSAPLECRSGRPRDPYARFLFGVARSKRLPLRVAFGPDKPIVALEPSSWVDFRVVKMFRPRAFISAFGGSGSETVELPRPGRYDAWIQGTMGPGVAVWVRPASQASYGKIGFAADDVGSATQWHPLNAAPLERSSEVHAAQAHRSWWRAASRHANVVGPVVLTREGDEARIRDVPSGRIGSLCGRRLDWLEILPPRA
jgi:hypothetical protein